MSPPPSAARLAFFEPSAERAARLDARVRERLAQSVRHVLERAGRRLAADEPVLATFFDRLERGRIQPQGFGAYADLVLAIRQDRLDAARARLAELVALPPPAPGVCFVALGDPDADTVADRWQRLVDADPHEPVILRKTSPELAERCAAHLRGALELLAAADPELHAELLALVCEIALAAGPRHGEAGAFDGVSSLFLWGAFLLNAATPRTTVEAARALAHESAHNLLYGIGCDDSLVENDPEERHPSPLRANPRPLAGSFHATFVLARMHRVTQRLLDSGLLEEAARREAERALREDPADFARGLEIVQRHARLTPLGAAVLDDARASMPLP